MNKTIENLTDEEWLELLVDSIEHPEMHGIRMPNFPTEALQKRIHGHSMQHSLQEAWRFFKVVKKYSNHMGAPLSKNTRLLDFGCGWGRIGRLFMKDIDSSNLFGYEPNYSYCLEARRNNIYINFLSGPYLPPLIMGKSSTDIVVSWSVFTHFPSFMASQWLAEFARILKEGGLVFLTMQGERFISTCQSWCDRLDSGEKLTEWESSVAKAFSRHGQVKRDFFEGRHVFLNTKPSHDAPSLYGDAFIPPAWMIQNCHPYFDVVDYVDGEELPQALCVLRKRSDNSTR